MDFCMWQKCSIFLNVFGMKIIRRSSTEGEMLWNFGPASIFSRPDWANTKQMTPCTFISDEDYWLSIGKLSVAVLPFLFLVSPISTSFRLAIHPWLWKHMDCFYFPLAVRHIFCSVGGHLSSRRLRVWPSCTETTWPSLKWSTRSSTLSRYAPLRIIMVRWWSLLMSQSVPPSLCVI